MPRLQDMTPEQMIGPYGYPERMRQGLLSEHVEVFHQQGGETRQATSGSGAQWAMVGNKAYPVLCSEIIFFNDEDGPCAGRCGQVATRYGRCEGHNEEARSWSDPSLDFDPSIDDYERLGTFGY